MTVIRSKVKDYIRQNAQDKAEQSKAAEKGKAEESKSSSKDKEKSIDNGNSLKLDAKQLSTRGFHLL